MKMVSIVVLFFVALPPLLALYFFAKQKLRSDEIMLKSCDAFKLKCMQQKEEALATVLEIIEKEKEKAVAAVLEIAEKEKAAAATLETNLRTQIQEEGRRIKLMRDALAQIGVNPDALENANAYWIDSALKLISAKIDESRIDPAFGKQRNVSVLLTAQQIVKPAMGNAHA